MSRPTRLLVFVLALPLVISAQELTLSSGEQLTLDRAIALAIQGNRQLQSVALEIEKSREGAAETRAKRLPQFSLNVLESQLLSRLSFEFMPGQFGTYPTIGPIPAARTEISTPLRPTTLVIGSVDQPLSQLYRLGLGIKAQEVGTDLARESLRQQRQKLTNQVKQAYYAILQSQSALQATEESLKLYRELDQLTIRYVAQQVALKSDSMNVKTLLAKAEYQTLVLRHTLASAKENLNQLLGRNLELEFTVQAVPELATYEMDEDSARHRALEQRSEIRQARLKVTQAELDQRAQKAFEIPDVSLSFRYLSPFNVNFVPKNIASVGLFLSWEPFDWGRKRRELTQKALTARQSNYALEEAESLVRLDVDTRFRKLAETKALLEVSRMAQETESEKLRVVMNKYKLNANLLKDVLQQQASVADLKDQYQQALLSFWMAKADLAKAMGKE